MALGLGSGSNVRQIITDGIIEGMAKRGQTRFGEKLDQLSLLIATSEDVDYNSVNVMDVLSI